MSDHEPLPKRPRIPQAESARGFSEKERIEKPRPTISTAPFANIAQSRDIEDHRKRHKERDSNTHLQSSYEFPARFRGRDSDHESSRKVEANIQTTRSKRLSPRKIRISSGNGAPEYYGAMYVGSQKRTDSRRHHSRLRHKSSGNHESRRLSSGGENRSGYWYWGRNSRGPNKIVGDDDRHFHHYNNRGHHSDNEPKGSNETEHGRSFSRGSTDHRKPNYYGESKSRHGRTIVKPVYGKYYESPYHFQKEDYLQRQIAYNEYSNKRKYFPSSPSSRTNVPAPSSRQRDSSHHRDYTYKNETEDPNNVSSKYGRGTIKEDGTVTETGKTPHRAFDYPWKKQFNYKKHYNAKRNSLDVYSENRKKQGIPNRSERWRTHESDLPRWRM